MNYRLATILAREAVSTDKTYVADIVLADCVSQFHICYESTGASSGAADGHAAKCVTKIELIDGSDVLFSLSGQEAQALDFYHRALEPANLNVYLNGMNAEMIFTINFGRFLWDTEFAFDPKKFTNPQLKITIDRNAGGCTSVAGFLTVLANIFDDRKIEPTGFLMHKEIKNYGLGDGTHAYTGLPTDYPYRKLLIAAQTYGVGPEYLLDTLKLSEDNDRKVPFQVTMFEMLRAMTGLRPPFRENVVLAGGANDNVFYCTPCYWPRLTVSAWDASNFTKDPTAFLGDGGRGIVYLSTSGGNYNVNVEGYAPHGAIEIPFGLQDDPADWYDVAALGSLELDILSKSGRSSSDKVQIYLQQLRPYAA